MPDTETIEPEKITKPINNGSTLNKVAILSLLAALIVGSISGYMLSTRSNGASAPAILNQPPKTASQDNQTFRDFAEGTIRKKPQPKDPSQYSEGTHLLQRDNGQTPVTLTSSVVDLSKYEGKKVKVFGETQKALDSGWLMDVGKVEEE